MGCRGCGHKAKVMKSGNLMEQYKYLNKRQIDARLELYKKRYCQDCEKRYDCDYPMYVKCKKNQ